MEIAQEKKISNVIILGAPRSGTTLLYDLLCSSDNVASLGYESHKYFDEFDVMERVQKLHNSSRHFAPLINSRIYRSTRGRFTRRILFNLYKHFAVPINESSVFVEKTPRNVYRLNEIYRMFPNAKFLVLRRDYRANYQSMMRGWHTKENFLLAFWRGSEFRFTGATKNLKLKFVEFNKPRIPAFGLPVGWEEHTDSLDSMVEFQLSESCRLLNEHVKKNEGRTLQVSFERLISSPNTEIDRINSFCETRIPYVSQLKRVNK